MIGVRQVRTCALKDFVRIAKAKNGARRDRLIRGVPQIHAAFQAFEACAPSVETLVPSALTKTLRDDLIHAYDVRTKPLEILIAKIMLLSREHACQYCGINLEADTLDHYLEKHAYPEYAVLYRNLVPCCSSCNRDRLPTIQSGQRAVLNLRDDPIDQIPDLLRAQVEPAGSGFRARFSLTTPSEAAHPVVAIYLRHFESLGLRMRFESASTNELAEVLRTLVDNQLPRKRSTFSRNLAREQVLFNAQSLEKRLGRNDWRVALRRGAAVCPDFLDACEKSWR
jgi:hypothetical protein